MCKCGLTVASSVCHTGNLVCNVQYKCVQWHLESGVTYLISPMASFQLPHKSINIHRGVKMRQ
uniref:Uncharacterized protein n=1 Tax=Anguilla anguilla TaxID=7936 RepID=A0A0E9RJE1_ANGAN